MRCHVSGKTEGHEEYLIEPLTVDVNIAADVGAAKRVGNLAGDRFCKEGVVHKNLICVSGDFLDYASSFGPPGEMIEKAQEGEDIKKWKSE